VLRSNPNRMHHARVLHEPFEEEENARSALPSAPTNSP
jgi:hypothetical protein